MIKTIKVKNQLRMDELIKYVFDNDIQNEMFRSNEKDMLVSVEHGRIFSEWIIDEEETFTVEVEEEITEDLILSALVYTTSYGTIDTRSNKSIADVLKGDGADCYTTNIYALIDGKLKLIWERESDE